MSPRILVGVREKNRYIPRLKVAKSFPKSENDITMEKTQSLG